MSRQSRGRDREKKAKHQSECRQVCRAKHCGTSHGFTHCYTAILTIRVIGGINVNSRAVNTNDYRQTPRDDRAQTSGSTRPATSPFYLPSQAADPTQSFFADYNGPGREILNPLPWIQHSVVPPSPCAEPSPAAEPSGARMVNEHMAEKAINEWRLSRGHPGEGNASLFALALALRRAGLGHHDIERTLHTEARFGRNPTERTAQVKSIMASLRHRRRRWR